MKRLKNFLIIYSLTAASLMTVTKAEVEAVSIQDKITLIFEDRLLTLDFRTNPELLQQTPQHYVTVAGQKLPVSFGENLPPSNGLAQLETEFTTTVNPTALENFFKTTSVVSNQASQPVKLSLKNNQVQFSGRPTTGYYEIDEKKLARLLNTALSKGDDYVRVPASRAFAPVVASEDLKERGIESVIAIGKSDFTGSSDARVQNILAAVRKFNGMIVPQGRTFSFNSTLKNVSEADGFVPELVIKGNETEKELGGGVCQVSTTVFRAAFKAGFPMVDRRNHSYAVPYYKPHGLDATIYLGGQDFRFSNDTPGDITMQAFTSGQTLFFVFYGQDDGRKVAVEGPFISNYRKAPAPEIIETDQLPVGEMVEASPAHDGFSSQWVRRVWKPGAEAQEEVLKSYYRPWAAKIWQGVDPAVVAKAEAETDPTDVSDNVEEAAFVSES